MSKHIGRKQRWTQESPSRYSSELGRVIYQERAWYSILSYKTRGPKVHESDLATWVAHEQQLGPFKRPRNAMVALEREATLLKNRHGDDLLIGDQLWAGA